MVTKIKGIFKGFKYISQIFVVKEKEMEIGLPTDVKHVAHIGWDGQSSSRSGSAPSWMNEFKAAPDFSATSLGSIGEPRDSYSTALSTWSSQDFDQSIGHRPTSDMFHDFPPIDSPNGSKHNRKKTKSSSSPKSISSSRSSRASKSKAAAHAGTNPIAKLQF